MPLGKQGAAFRQQSPSPAFQALPHGGPVSEGGLSEGGEKVNGAVELDSELALLLWDE